jgi:hypothetical protein
MLTRALYRQLLRNGKKYGQIAQKKGTKAIQEIQRIM